MKTLLIDPRRCLRCSNCWVACKDEHCDNDWSPIAAPQGEGQWWIRIEETEVASGAHMKLHRVPVTCQQCEDAPCIKASDGAAYRRDDGIVIIDPTKAKGKKAIMDACPYGAVYWNEELELPQKCTMCAHLLDAGWEKPRCATACPNDAIQFVDTADLNDESMYAPLERLHPEFKTAPQVAYVNLPKVFLAGELVSDDEKICVEDAEVKLIHQVTGAVYEAYSGTYGDFWVYVGKPGFYTAQFKKEGYKRKQITDIDLRESMSLDVVKLHPMVE